MFKLKRGGKNLLPSAHCSRKRTKNVFDSIEMEEKLQREITRKIFRKGKNCILYTQINTSFCYVNYCIAAASNSNELSISHKCIDNENNFVFLSSCSSSSTYRRRHRLPRVIVYMRFHYACACVRNGSRHGNIISSCNMLSMELNIE